MTNKTKNTLKIASIIIAILIILMALGVLPNVIVGEYHFWVMVIAYFLLVLSLR